MSTAKKPTVLDALSGVSGIPRPEILEIAKRVRENHERLAACAAPHDFVDDTPEKPIGKTFRCTKCKGTVESLHRGWYERGRDHERALLTGTVRVLTCAFCGTTYPPGTPESNHEALTAHVRVCPEHPMRPTLDVLRRIVAAWREDDSDQIVGVELIEEAEALLGVENAEPGR